MGSSDGTPTPRVLRLAAVQFAPLRAESSRNRARVLELLECAVSAGAKFIAIPECAVSGYDIVDRKSANELAEPIPGPTTSMLEALCERAGCHVVCGLLEREHDYLYNTAVLVGSRGVVGRHRKVHIAPVGADAFTTPGAALEVFEADGVKVGLSICYEVRFPEVARTQALRGAQLLVVVANWPRGAEVNPEIMAPARAAENNVVLLAANRSGTEGKLHFLGRSAVFGADGRPLRRAGDKEEVLVADVHLTGGLGRLNIGASGYHVDLRGHRRPDLYREITAPFDLVGSNEDR